MIMAVTVTNWRPLGFRLALPTLCEVKHTLWTTTNCFCSFKPFHTCSQLLLCFRLWASYFPNVQCFPLETGKQISAVWKIQENWEMLGSHFTTLPSSCSVFCVLLTRKELARWERPERAERAELCSVILGRWIGFSLRFRRCRGPPFLLDGLHGFRAGESRVKSHAESLMWKPEFHSTAGGIQHGSPAESSGEKTTPSWAQLGVWEAADYPNPLWMPGAGTALGSEWTQQSRAASRRWVRTSTPFHRFNSSQISEGHEVNNSQEF